MDEIKLQEAAQRLKAASYNEMRLAQRIESVSVRLAGLEDVIARLQDITGLPAVEDKDRETVMGGINQAERAKLGAMRERDPWAHRSAGLRCSTCLWYAPKSTDTLGRCRRHAPTMQGYPAVFPADWCGDHKLDEKAVQP